MDFRDRLQAGLGDAYLLDRELGGGGMSRVFLAEERALGRKVVIKVLSPELAADVSSERFAREIRLAASLQHANIVPLLSAGSIGGLPYYSMPFVDGESLRQLLVARGALPVAVVVNVLRDVARALDYAHERGVIHRDIKPDNVLLSGAAAVVTDFGIAKAISASLTVRESANVTSTGTFIGTPTYIAPEQALGDPNIDGRADLYAFGCLAYELLAGTPPFANRTAQQLVYAHIAEQPPNIASVRPEVVTALAALVARCLAKSPADRPANAREILGVLDTLDSRGGTLVGVPRRAARASWRGRPRVVAGGLVALAVALAAGAAVVRARGTRGTDAPRTLAVMPFMNVGGDSTQEYFAEGVAIDLTSALSKVPGVRVTSHSLAFAYKGKTTDIRTVGRELGVDALLEATVQRLEGRVRVNCQLTRAADGVTLWSDTYERDARDVFGVQDAITASIVDALRPTLSGRAAAAGARANVAGTTNFDAYNSYLRGVYLLEHRGPGVAAAGALFRDAIAKDSGFARAYGMLAESLQLLPYFSPTPASSVQDEAFTAARTALRLDSTVVDAHIALGLGYDHSFRWLDGERELRTALRLDSANSVAHVQYGRNLMYRGRLAEALEEFRRATTTDPLSGTAFVWRAHMLSLVGKHDSSLAVGRHARDTDPGLMIARAFGAQDALAAGDRQLARTLVLGAAEGNAAWRGLVAFSLGMAGDSAGAMAIVRDVGQLPHDAWMRHTGLAYGALGIGDTTRALAELEAALRAREIAPEWEPFSDRMFDPIRGSARFAAVVRGFNLDDRVFTAQYGGRPGR